MTDDEFDAMQAEYDLCGVDGRLRDFAEAVQAAERERLAAKFMADAQAAHDRGNYVRRDELCTAAGLVLKA